MAILGSPEEQAIPVGYITFEKVPVIEPSLPPVAIEAKTDWMPWVIVGLLVLLILKG